MLFSLGSCSFSYVCLIYLCEYQGNVHEKDDDASLTAFVLISMQEGSKICAGSVSVIPENSSTIRHLHLEQVSLSLSLYTRILKAVWKKLLIICCWEFTAWPALMLSLWLLTLWPMLENSIKTSWRVIPSRTKVSNIAVSSTAQYN